MDLGTYDINNNLIFHVGSSLTGNNSTFQLLTPSEADFDEFEIMNDEDNSKPLVAIESYEETDRIDIPNKPLIKDFDEDNQNDSFIIAVGSVGDPEPAYHVNAEVDPSSLISR